MSTSFQTAQNVPTKTILLVEDEAPVRQILSAALHHKYEILESKDGVEAVNIFEKNLARILVVVTDLEMPRLGGDMLTAWIHSIRPGLPVILISGLEQDYEPLRSLIDSGAVRFLAKPFDLCQLEEMIDAAVA